MRKDKYVLLDNSNYLDYYLTYLKDSHIPIVLRDQTRSILDSQGISSIGIFNFVDSIAMKDAIKKALDASNNLLSVIDRDNKHKYMEMFGTNEIRLFQASAGFLFKRFAIATFKFIAGLEGIVRNNDVSELVYLHDGKPMIICGTFKERGFFFSDDITWNILGNWHSANKPALKRITVKRGSVMILSMRQKGHILRKHIMALKVFLSPLKKALFNSIRKKPIIYKNKKNLLFLYPFYDFSLLLDSGALNDKFNILTWDPDESKYLFNSEEETSSSSTILAEKLNFSANSFNSSIFADALNIKDLFIPLLKSFYEKKIKDMLYYWKQAKAIHQRNKIDMVSWGNSPHRYPAGMVREYFRINKVPVCGMQHGGLNGSNHIGRLLFETEYNQCDIYFSYGFSETDLKEEAYSYGVSIFSKVKPVGSLRIKRLRDEFKKNCASSRRQEVDILLPVTVINNEFYWGFEENAPRLFEFQKRIIDSLAGFSDKKIIIKFPLGNCLDNPLGFYIEHKYPKKFQVIDNISFSDCLYKFKADTIIIERQSTPLNEAIVTESNIIVYNDKDWCGLTDKARRLLSKRAIVCDDEEGFFFTINDCLEGRVEKKDIHNREFIENYCIYTGNPQDNIEKTIVSLLNAN